MTWVKVCGMTRREDVELAVDAGADAVGFVVAPSSPRRVDIVDVAELARSVSASTFLVAVDLPPDDLMAAAAVAGVDGVQPHGRHAAPAADAARDAGLAVLFPVGIAPGAKVVDLDATPRGATPLLDTRVEGLDGGTGVSFDWSLASELERRFVVAGGLDPTNVAEAVAVTGAWGVDVASGVEAEPGRKDPEKVRAFVEAVR